jgi:hypothetical protein
VSFSDLGILSHNPVLPHSTRQPNTTAQGRTGHGASEGSSKVSLAPAIPSNSMHCGFGYPKGESNILVTSFLRSDTGILIGSYKILCHEDGTTAIDFWLLLALLSPTANLGVEAVPLTTPLPRCNIKPAQHKAIPSSLRGNCSSFEVLIQCNRIESRVITGEAFPLSLQLGSIILWFKILSN